MNKRKLKYKLQDILNVLKYFPFQNYFFRHSQFFQTTLGVQMFIG